MRRDRRLPLQLPASPYDPMAASGSVISGDYPAMAPAGSGISAAAGRCVAGRH